MLLLFLAGLAIAGAHILVGLLLAPFFGGGPFLWAQVLMGFIASLAFGAFIGNSKRLRGRFDSDSTTNWRAPNDAANFLIGFGGLWIAATPLMLTRVARLVLDADPDNLFAASIITFILLVIPGAALAAAPFAAMRKLTHPSLDKPKRCIAAFALGALAGPFAVSPALLDSEIPTHLNLAVLGWLPAVVVALQTFSWRGLAGVAVATALPAIALVEPGELGSLEYQTALRRFFKIPMGRYYLATAGRRVLRDTEIQKHYEDIVKQLQGQEDPTAAGIIVLVETLKEMGPVETTGEGLLQTLRKLLSQDARRYVIPLLEPFAKVSSDGKGRINFVLKPEFRKQVNRFPLSPGPGEEVFKLLLKEDFTLVLTQRERSTLIRIEPQKVEKASFFEINETYTTPLQIKDVKLFIDAHLLAVIIENNPDRIIVKVRAQGEIGPVVTEVIEVIEK